MMEDISFDQVCVVRVFHCIPGDLDVHTKELAEMIDERERQRLDG